MTKEWIEAFLTLGTIGGISTPVSIWVINYWKTQKIKIIENSVGAEAVKSIKTDQARLERNLERLEHKMEKNIDETDELREEIKELVNDSKELNQLIRKAFFKD